MAAAKTTAVIFLAAILLNFLPLLTSLRSYLFRVSSSSSIPLNMFDFFKKKNNEKQQPTSAPLTVNVDKVKTEKLKSNLEKISFTQNRDYEKEAQEREKAKAPAKPKDMQLKSFNFNKQNEFPNLYKGWIKTEGDQIGKQIIASTKAALSKNENKFLEVLFDPVPNLDEVAFGTEWNKKLRKDVCENLKVPDFATNRGGPSTLEWSNIYWGNRLAEGLKSQFKGDIILLSISGEGLKGQNTPTLTKGARLLGINVVKKSPVELINNDGPVGLFILLSPCSETHYKDGIQLAEKFGVPLIALNAPFSYRYDVGGGSPFLLSYVMKRIPKGWIYRQYPKDFEIILEGPDYEILRAYSSSVQLPLPEISRISMQASAEKYGSTGNDRIFQNRL